MGQLCQDWKSLGYSHECMILEPSHHGEDKPRLNLRVIQPPEGFDSYKRLADWESQFTLLNLLVRRLIELLPREDSLEFLHYHKTRIVPELEELKTRRGEEATCFIPEFFLRFLLETKIEVYRRRHLMKRWGPAYRDIVEIVNFLKWRIYSEIKPQLSRFGKYGISCAASAQAECGGGDEKEENGRPGQGAEAGV